MPTPFETLAVFAAAIAPGYGFLSGYQHQRAHSHPDRDLHAYAQAFVVSSIWIAVTWWPAGHLLVKWTCDEQLGTHEPEVWLLACALLGLPYVLGRLFGQLLLRVSSGRCRWLFSFFDAIGVFDPPTLWESTWEYIRSRGPAVVVILLKDGTVIEGQFASRSRVDFSPRPPRVYLERAYGYDQNGQRIVFHGGVYIAGREIAALWCRD
jgi:hypothetical protein